MENSPASASTATLDQPASTSTATLDQPSLIPTAPPTQPRFPKGQGHKHTFANHSEDSDIAKTVRLGLILATTTPEEAPNHKPPAESKPASAKADTVATTTAAAYTAAREQTRQLHAITKPGTHDSAREREEVSDVAALPPVEQARTYTVLASQQTTLQSPFQSPLKTARPEDKKSKVCAVAIYDERESEESDSDSGSGNDDEASFSDGESGSRSGSDGSCNSDTGYLLT